MTVGSHRPLDVLRATVGAGHLPRETREPSHVATRRARRRVPRTDLADASAPVDQGSPAIDLSRDQRVRPTIDGGDEEAVTAPGHRVSAEQHATPLGIDHRLHQHRHRGVDEAGLAGGRCRPDHGVDRDEEVLLVADVQHGFEHARHRRLTAVLAGRRRAHHDPRRAVTGEATPGVGGRFDVVRAPAGGQHHTRQRRQAGGAGAGQVGGLGTDERRIDGAWVVQLDDGWKCGHEHTIAVPACSSLTAR